MSCPERDRLTEDVVRSVRAYGSAIAQMKRAQGTADFNKARAEADEARRAYDRCRTAFDDHERMHSCVPTTARSSIGKFKKRSDGVA
jgi:hypothetical protein